MQTPWGKSDFRKVYAPGIIWYGTPSHGGFHLDQESNALVHAAWRQVDGWYEEDCDWAIVAWTFPYLFSHEEYERARHTLVNWHPDAYMMVTGIKLAAKESYTLRQREFAEATKTKMVTVSAIGVEGGMVKVTACIGGRLPNGRYASWDLHDYIVPAADYEARDEEMSFVVDTAKYQEVA